MVGLIRGLRRRVADALQRGLFDPPPVPAPVAPAPPAATKRPSLPAAPAGASRSISIDGQTVVFALRRSRRRTIGFVVGAEGLSVRAPKWVTLRDIDAAVREKGRWIVAKLTEQRERQARLDAARPVWKHGATIAYLGEPVTIVLDARQGLADGEVAVDDGPPRCLRVGLPMDAADERVRDAVQSWLQREARRVFAQRAAHFAPLLGVRVTRLSLSSAQTRWGSANASGAVRLNWRLVHFALPTIDYVVAHELAHLREMNHGPRFWAVVRSVVPDYEAARSRLRDDVAVAAR